MLNHLVVLLDKGLNLAPKKGAWIETAGYLLIGLGLLIGIAAYSFSPADYADGMVRVGAVRNAAGPVGALLAGHILSKFGLVGLVWPVVLVIWGLFVAMGFMIFPTAKRVIGFLLMTIVFSTFAEIQLARIGLSEPAFGYGGAIGLHFSIPLLKYFHYAGSVIMLGVAAFAVLALTGNVTILQTAEKIELGRYYLVRGFKKYIKWLKKMKAKEDARLASLQALESGNGQWNLGNASPARRTAVPAGAAPATAEPGEAKAVKKPTKAAAKAEIESDNKGANEESLDFNYRGGAHGRPNARLFRKSEPPKKHPANYHRNMADKLTAQLQEFKVEGKVKNVTEGPVVTTFEFEPSAGTKVSKITNLAEDLARLLQARSLRILAPIPGKQTLGFEVPNDEARLIGFADLLADKSFTSTKIALPVCMGLDTFGKPVIADLAAMPHLLVAGSTGSGKSVFMNSLIASLVTRHTAKDLRLVMIDPKMVEMAAYNGIPHMACPVITDAQEVAKSKLNALVREMENRYLQMQAVGAKNISSFNQIIRSRRKSEFVKYNGKWEQLPYIILIVDELADMMMVLGKEAETPITRLAQKARAAGIHLVIATQRPSADVVTGLIKANFPTRVAFRVLSGVDSRTILDQNGAETLLGKGDMIYLSEKGMERMHGAYISDDEVARMVKTLKRK